MVMSKMVSKVSALFITRIRRGITAGILQIATVNCVHTLKSVNMRPWPMCAYCMHYMAFSVLIRLHCLCSTWAALTSDGQEKQGSTVLHSSLRHCMFNACIVSASKFTHNFKQPYTLVQFSCRCPPCCSGAIIILVRNMRGQYLVVGVYSGGFFFFGKPYLLCPRASSPSLVVPV